jgi:catechol 2,3-dioxygenase-like lactoylglutathione lyase family enzyme
MQFVMVNKKRKFLKIDHVQLAAPVGSEEKARRFFGTICGMKEVPKPDNLRKRGGVWFQVGSNQLHIGMEDPKSFHPNKKAHPAFEVTSLEETRQRLISSGVFVRIDEPLEGADRFYTEDPFGNRLEFIQRKRRN